MCINYCLIYHKMHLLLGRKCRWAFFNPPAPCQLQHTIFLANRIGLPSPSFPSLLLFWLQRRGEGSGGIVIFHASGTLDTLDHFQKQRKQAAYQGWMFSFLLVILIISPNRPCWGTAGSSHYRECLHSGSPGEPRRGCSARCHLPMSSEHSKAMC